MTKNLNNAAEILNPAADATPFVSRFNQWMNVIAIVVLAVFIPDQISWAFGYNPAVLYRNLPIYNPVATALATDLQSKEQGILPKPAMQVAGSLEYLLKQIQDKPKLRLQLNLDPSNVIPDSSSVIPAQAGI